MGWTGWTSSVGPSSAAVTLMGAVVEMPEPPPGVHVPTVVIRRAASYVHGVLKDVGGMDGDSLDHPLQSEETTPEGPQGSSCCQSTMKRS